MWTLEQTVDLAGLAEANLNLAPGNEYRLRLSKCYAQTFQVILDFRSGGLALATNQHVYDYTGHLSGAIQATRSVSGPAGGNSVLLFAGIRPGLTLSQDLGATVECVFVLAASGNRCTGRWRFRGEAEQTSVNTEGSLNRQGSFGIKAGTHNIDGLRLSANGSNYDQGTLKLYRWTS